MNKLTVTYNGWGERWPLGVLAEFGHRSLFEYSPEALRQGLELSPLHLALREPAYEANEPFLDGLPGLIADALPDGWGRLLTDRRFRKVGRDPATVSALERLAFIGDRALGALSFEPANGIDAIPQDMSLLDLAHRIDRLTAGASIAVLNQLLWIGGSPQGARPKALVRYDRCSGTMTKADADNDADIDNAHGEAWLIKFPARGEHAEVCAIEELYARLARAVGIDMTESDFFPLGRGLAAFGVKRFDQEAGLRVPVHTLAGVLHTDYRVPTVDAIDFMRMTRLMTNDMREVLKAFERCVFNLVFHNRDDHAKNFSYRLGRDRRWQLSPAYDLTFSVGPRGHHQMAYAGETAAPSLADVLRVAAKGGLDAASARRTIERVLAMAAELESRAAGLPIRKATLRGIVKAVTANVARLKR
jgi:serine/threonine-protein kinase HipA